MSIPASYLGVILIWSTTPLAIKWSGEGTGFLFGVASRMTISTVLALALVRLLGLALPLDARARRAYLAGGGGIFAAMTSVYWGAQHIPSGWVSLVFGITPIVTGVMAAAWLGERALTPARLLGMATALAGLAVIFARGLDLGPAAVSGIGAVLLATVFQSASAVWVKRIGADIPALSMAAGSLAVSLPLFALAWWVTGSEWPAAIPGRAVGAILYLAVFGSVLGFTMYYFLIRHIEASRVALVPIITPVTALLLGNLLNGEPLGPRVMAGAALVLAGLGTYEFGGLLRRRLAAARRDRTPG